MQCYSQLYYDEPNTADYGMYLKCCLYNRELQVNCNPQGGLEYLAKCVLTFLGFKMTNFCPQILKPLGTSVRDFTVVKRGTEKFVERRTSATVQYYSF